MVRRASYGDDLPLGEVECRCGREYENPIAKLNTIEAVVPLEPEKTEFETACPTGLVIQWRVLDGAREALFSKVRDSLKGKDSLTWSILIRVTKIGDKVVRIDDDIFTAAGKIRQTRELLNTYQLAKRMKGRDRNHLRKEFRKFEGHIDLRASLVCPDQNCKAVTIVPIDIGTPDFFFPGEVPID